MRVKEQMMQEQQQEFELDLSYAEWLRDNSTEPNEAELDLMEKDFNKPLSASSQIITQSALHVKALNSYIENLPTGA